MHAWEAIQKAVDEIEENVSHELKIESLAAGAGLSPFYFQRLFRRLVGRPVGEYIKLRRLALACRLLPDRGTRIVDVALACGFSSHEALTRAFGAAYGMTPEQYRSRPVHLQSFVKPQLLLRYVLADEGVPVVTDEMVLEMRRVTLQAPREFCGISGYVSMADTLPPGETTGVSAPGQLWERFHAGKQTMAGLVPGGDECGAVFRGDAPAGHFTYFAGAQAQPAGCPPGFERWTLPAGPYVVCAFEAEDREALVTAALDRALGYALRWIDRHGLTVSPDTFSAELYPCLPDDIACMEHWLPAVEKS